MASTGQRPPNILIFMTDQEQADWQNSTLIRGNLTEELGKLKNQPGKNIGPAGSATLVRSLVRARHDGAD